MKIARFLEQNPDYQIHLAGRRAAKNLNRNLKVYGLSMTQALILTALYFEADQTSTFEDLAKTFEMTKGGLSQHLSDLESKKWVSRPQQRDDRRSFSISLKKEAHTLCLDLIKIFDQHQQRLEAQFGESALGEFLATLRVFTSETKSE